MRHNDIYTLSVPGERSSQQSSWSSRNQRQLGHKLYCTDVDALWFYNCQSVAVVEYKRGNEGIGYGQQKVLCDLADRAALPAFIVRYWPESLQFAWEPMNKIAEIWLDTVPFELRTKQRLCESDHIQLQCMIRNLSEAETQAQVDYARRQQLFQTPNESRVQYTLEAFIQRDLFYPDPVAAFEAATSVPVTAKPAFVLNARRDAGKLTSTDVERLLQMSQQLTQSSVMLAMQNIQQGIQQTSQQLKQLEAARMKQIVQAGASLQQIAPRWFANLAA